MSDVRKSVPTKATGVCIGLSKTVIHDNVLHYVLTRLISVVFDDVMFRV